MYIMSSFTILADPKIGIHIHINVYVLSSNMRFIFVLSFLSLTLFDYDVKSYSGRIVHLQISELMYQLAVAEIKG